MQKSLNGTTGNWLQITCDPRSTLRQALELESIIFETDCLSEEIIATFFGFLSRALSYHTWEYKIPILAECVLLVSRMWLQCMARSQRSV